MNLKNKVILKGHVGADANFYPAKSSENEDFCRFSICVNDSYKKKTGELIDNALWVTIHAYGYNAKFCGENCKRGVKILLEGKLSLSEYTNEATGIKHSTFIVILNESMLIK